MINKKTITYILILYILYTYILKLILIIDLKATELRSRRNYD